MTCEILRCSQCKIVNIVDLGDLGDYTALDPTGFICYNCTRQTRFAHVDWMNDDDEDGFYSDYFVHGQSFQEVEKRFK